MSFPDHFSKHADRYAAFRPQYPDSLFQFLASLVEERSVAWDCATGNGQAAKNLAQYFRNVVATDASTQQILRATRMERIHYCVAVGENAPLKTETVDLTTVAQALHWLKPEPFLEEVRRVLKPGGIVSAWCYNLLSVDPRIDSMLLHFYKDIVGPHWAPERKLLEDGYRTIPFPFDEMAAPPLFMELEWSFSNLIGYLGTWSASQEYARVCGSDPVERVLADLETAWGDPNSRKRICWPLSFRIGRKM